MDSLIPFPVEREVKKYFSSETWDFMADYEKWSYGNILRNYMMMASLGLNPVKPSFMTQQETRTAVANSATACPLPPKKPCLTDTDQPQFSSNMVQQNKAVEWFSLRDKTLSIRLSNVFSAVLKVYKELRICRRTTDLGMLPSVRTRKKLLKEILRESRAEDSDIGMKEGNEDNQIEHKSLQTTNNLGNEVSSIEHKCHMNSKLFETHDKEFVDGRINDEKDQDKNCIRKGKQEIKKTMSESLKASPTQAKKPCRSVQTQTVTAASSHLTSDLTFSCDSGKVMYPPLLCPDSYQKLCQGTRPNPVRVEPRHNEPADIQSLAKLCDGKKTYFCWLCPYKTMHKSHMKQHLVTHTGERAHVCYICDKAFHQSSHLVVHMRTHTGKKPFSCNQCMYTFKTVGKLKQHMKQHNGENVHTCLHRSCKTIQRLFNMKCYSLTQDGNEPHSCILCSCRATDRNIIIKHIGTHVPVGKKHYSNTQCSYRATKSSNMTQNMRNYWEKPYGCSHCKYRTVQKCNLIKHLRIHTREPYLCTKCSYRTTCIDTLTKHMRSHKGKKPYSCAQCSYKAVQKSALTSHMRTHTREKPYCCTQCSYRATQSNALTSHIRTHIGEKPHGCSYCQYRTVQKCNLTKHLRIHTKEKPYSCAQCSYKAVQRSALITHMRTHTGEKPYSCAQCPFRTAQSITLIVHMKTHIAENPYACYHCQYRAVKKSNLSRHIARHHVNK